MSSDGVIVDDVAPRRVRASAPRPLEALDAQVALIDALKSQDGGQLVFAMTGTGDELQRMGDGEPPRRGNRASIPGPDKPGHRTMSHNAAQAMSNTLNHATTVVVTSRMLDHVLRHMDEVPFGDPLVPDDLFFESAYIVLPRAVAVGPLDEDDRTVFPPRKVAWFDAGFYIPMAVTTRDQLRGTEQPADGIMYAQACSLPLLERYFDAENDGPEDRAALQEGIEVLRAMKIVHAPIYATGMGFGLSWDPELREEDFVLTAAGEFERRFWLTMLRTLKQEVFAPVRFKRAVARRIARHRGLIPDVVVADLRRVKHRGTEELLPTGETVMWSHRWMRRAHPRVLNRGTDKEKTVWVREHVCGPESMPLILKDRVYRLSR